MAYITQDIKKELMPKIKSVLKKFNSKASVKISDYCKLTVTISSTPYDFGGRDSLPTHAEHIDHSYKDEAANFLHELVAAMKGKDWKDESDMMTDYFQISWYLGIDVNC